MMNEITVERVNHKIFFFLNNIHRIFIEKTTMIFKICSGKS